MFKDYFSKEELKEIQSNVFKTIRANQKVYEFLKTLWESNFESVGFKHLATEIFENIRKEVSQSDQFLITRMEQILQDKDFKRQARHTRKHDFAPRMLFQYELVKEYVDQSQVFLDFGCGKMALIRKICKENDRIQTLYGYDPKSNPESISFDNRAKFVTDLAQIDDFRRVDTVYSSFVFHHLSTEEIQKSLKDIFEILKPGGRFIFIEESFFEENREEKLENSQKFLQKIGFDVQSSTNLLFKSLDSKDKFLAIYLNDVLINLKNLDYMPWTFEYRNIENWSELLKKHGFKVENVYDFRVVDSGRLKQGVTSMIVCTKE